MIIDLDFLKAGEFDDNINYEFRGVFTPKELKLPNNLTIDGTLDLEDWKYSELPKNLKVGRLLLGGSKISTIRRDTKYKELHVSNEEGLQATIVGDKLTPAGRTVRDLVSVLKTISNNWVGTSLSSEKVRIRSLLKSIVAIQTTIDISKGINYEPI